MSIITFTSDFGLIDYRVSAVKGKIFSLKKDITIIDISHEIQAYNLLHTAYVVRNAYSFFPKNSVHIISVDSFYHKDRKFIICKSNGHYFVTADNGLISLIFNDEKSISVYEINIEGIFNDEINSPSTDIFAPAAVHLLNGGLPEIIGKKLFNPKQLSFPLAVFNENEKMIIGEIMYIDNFSNAVSNISKNFFEKYNSVSNNFKVKFRNLSLSKIYNQYTDIISEWKNEREYHGKPMAIFNDAGFIELAIYKGNKQNGAKTLFGLNIGEKIYIEFY